MKSVGMKLLLIVALAVTLRVAMAAINPMQQPDSADYRMLGERLAKGGAYEVNGLYAVRMPGYPAMLAVVFAILGPTVRGALVVQAVFGGLMVVPVFWLGRRISDSVGLLGALLVAVDPLSVAFSAALLTETPFTLMLLLSLLAAVRIMEGGRFWWWLVLGVLWAVGVYLRASALYLIVPLGVVAAIYGRPGILRRVAGPAVAVGIVVAALVPWQVVNVVRFRAGYLALTSLEGISLYESVYPDADGGPKQDLLQPTAEMRNMNEMQRNDAWGREAWRFMREDPGRVALLGVRKVGRTWNPLFNAGEMQHWGVQAVGFAWHVPLFGLAIIGMFTRSISNRMKVLLLMPVVYFTLVHAVYLGSVRYRVPLMPLVCVFAAAGLITLWNRWGRQRAKPAKTT